LTEVLEGQDIPETSANEEVALDEHKEEVEVVAAVEDDVRCAAVDISIPYDAAAKLAFDGSDNSMANSFQDQVCDRSSRVCSIKSKKIESFNGSSWHK